MSTSRFNTITRRLRSMTHNMQISVNNVQCADLVKHRCRVKFIGLHGGRCRVEFIGLHGGHGR